MKTATKPSDTRKHSEERFVRRTIGVANVHCPICAGTLQDVVRALPGVRRATVDYSSGRVRVSFDSQVTSEEELLAALSNGGFDIAV